MSKRRGYSGAYRDSKDRIRPITPKKRSTAKTGAPIRVKKKKKVLGPRHRSPEGLGRLLEAHLFDPENRWLEETYNRGVEDFYAKASPQEKTEFMLKYEQITKSHRARSSQLPSGPPIDPETRSFKSAGPTLEHGWTKTADGPADAKSVNANATAKEWFGVMTLTVPSMEVPGKFVVYFRDHPENKPPKAELDLARKNNQNVMMWNNQQWEWSYLHDRWLPEWDMATGEDVGRLLDEPGAVVVSARRNPPGHQGGLMDRNDLEAAYVNSYRRRFNTSKGLSVEKTQKMSDRELRMAIRGNNEMADLSGR